MVAMLKVAIQATPHKEDREKATAIVTLVTPGVEYIMAVERGDKLTAERYKELMHQVLEGMDAMVSAFIADRDPQRWARLAEVIGKRYPALNPFVDSVMAQAAMRGVVVANLLNSAANLSFGLHAWYEGLGLEAVADDIRADQQHAAGTLRLLLPHARAARESARRREERLQRLIDALQNDNPPPPPRPVPPPADILDDSKGIPPGLYVGLPTTLEVLQGSPAMTYHLTDKEVQRQEAIAEAAREAEEERERAAEREEEERQEEEAQAQRYQAWQEARADEQRNWRRRRYSPVPQGVDHTNYAGINQVISNVTGGLGD
jgi:hypothetical protein